MQARRLLERAILMYQGKAVLGRNSLFAIAILLPGCLAPAAGDGDAAPPHSYPSVVSAVRTAADTIGGSPVGVVANSTFHEMDQNRMRVWYTLQNVGSTDHYVTGVRVLAKNGEGDVLAENQYGSVFRDITTRFLRPGQVAGAWSDIYLQPGQIGKTTAVEYQVSSEAPFGKVASDWGGGWRSRTLDQRWNGDAYEVRIELTNDGPEWRSIDVTLVTYDAAGRAVGIGEASASAYAGTATVIRVGEADSRPDDDFQYHGANAVGSPVRYSLAFDYPG